eukprot:scaffold12642_cov64-Phaeocystis_antarctica.AAC.1
MGPSSLIAQIFQLRGPRGALRAARYAGRATRAGVLRTARYRYRWSDPTYEKQVVRSPNLLGLASVAFHGCSCSYPVPSLFYPRVLSRPRRRRACVVCRACRAWWPCRASRTVPA